MQCAMDIRLASEKARYGFVFSRRAIVLGRAQAGSFRGSSGSKLRLNGHSRGAFEASEALDEAL